MGQRIMRLGIVAFGFLHVPAVGGCAGTEEDAVPHNSGRFVPNPRSDAGPDANPGGYYQEDTGVPPGAGDGRAPTDGSSAGTSGEDTMTPPQDARASTPIPPTDEDSFGIYSESVHEDVKWDTDCKLDAWTGNNAGIALTREVNELGFGSRSLKVVGTGDWMGFGIRSEPKTQSRDLSAYTKLRFMVKGPKGRQFSIGMTDASGREVWINPTTPASIAGMTLDGSWETVTLDLAKIPARAPATGVLDTSNVVQFFMFSAGNETGYVNGDVFYFDEIYLFR